MNNRRNKLVVEFDDELVNKLESWKRRCMGLNGKGGIKERVQNMILKDLEVLEKDG